MPDKSSRVAASPGDIRTGNGTHPAAAACEDAPASTVRSRALDPTTHDAILAARIAEHLAGATEVDASDVRVVVRNRGVSLFGSVGSSEQRERVGALSRRVSGVVDVLNHLKVLGPRQ